jgi:lysophospholipase L1-like esterase
VCEEYGIRVTNVYEIFMGEDDSKNPEEDGLISNGFHTTSEGQEIIADLLYDLGD